MKTRAVSGRERGGEPLVKSTTYLRLSVARRLRMHTAETFVPMSEVIEAALEKYIDAYESKRPDKKR